MTISCSPLRTNKAAWPKAWDAQFRLLSRGGFLVQTIHDPWGNGHSAVGLFGSDLKGVQVAVARFLDMLEAGRTLLVGPTFDVKFGPDALKIPKLLDDTDLEVEVSFVMPW